MVQPKQGNPGRKKAVRCSKRLEADAEVQFSPGHLNMQAERRYNSLDKKIILVQPNGQRISYKIWKKKKKGTFLTNKCLRMRGKSIDVQSWNMMSILLEKLNTNEQNMLGLYMSKNIQNHYLSFINLRTEFKLIYITQSHKNINVTLCPEYLNCLKEYLTRC